MGNRSADSSSFFYDDPDMGSFDSQRVDTVRDPTDTLMHNTYYACLLKLYRLGYYFIFFGASVFQTAGSSGHVETVTLSELMSEAL